MESAPVYIRILPIESAEDSHLMQEITDLVNQVYSVAEDGQWLPGVNRTTVDEIAEFTRAGQIFVAQVDGVVVGSIRVQLLDSTTGESGMLSVDPKYRNRGVGRSLRSFITAHLHSQGVTTLQIELLKPRNWVQPSKRVMIDWNERAGYKVVRKGAFEDQYPHLAPYLATPCDFIIYEKKI